MKKVVSLVLAFLVFLMPTSFAEMTVKNTSDNVVVTVNNVKVVFPDQKPVIMNDRTYVPVRAVSETLKAEVSWNGEARIAYVERFGVRVAIPIGSAELTVTKGEQTQKVKMDVEAVIIGDRTLLPIRFVAEALGASVGWDEKTRTVLITDSQTAAGDPTTPQDPTETTTDPTVLVSLTLSDRDITMNRYDTYSLIATAVYGDGRQLDVTQTASWQSSSSGIATVEKGEVTAKAFGTTILTASYGGKNASCNLTVEATGSGIDGISVSPLFVTVEEGQEKQINAQVKYGDGRMEDITQKAEWDTGDETVVAVNEGLITALKEGSAVISVFYEGFAKAIMVTVLPKPEDYSGEDLSTVTYTYDDTEYVVYGEGAGVFADIVQYDDLTDSTDREKAVNNGSYVVVQVRLHGPLTMFAMDMALMYNEDALVPMSVKRFSDGHIEALGAYGEKGYDEKRVALMMQDVFEDDVMFDDLSKESALILNTERPIWETMIYRFSPLVLEENEEFYAFNLYFKKLDGTRTLEPGDLFLSDHTLQTSLYAFDAVSICYAAEKNTKDKKWIPNAFHITEIVPYEGPQLETFVIESEKGTDLPAGSVSPLHTFVQFDDGSTEEPAVTYTTTDREVAWVDDGILLTGIPGTATISANYWGTVATLTVTVLETQ